MAAAWASFRAWKTEQMNGKTNTMRGIESAFWGVLAEDMQLKHRKRNSQTLAIFGLID
jgi:hypothetical protein